MKKDKQDTKIRKAVLNIEKKVIDIYNSLNDMNLKLSHIIRSQRPYDDIYYDMVHGIGKQNY